MEQGRLEEAAKLAGQPEVRSYLPVQQLVVQIGEQLARRALERAANGDFAGAWRDLDEAQQIALAVPSRADQPDAKRFLVLCPGHVTAQGDP